MNLIRISNLFEKYRVKIYSRLLRYSFKRCGIVTINRQVRIDNPDCIILEDGVSLGRRGWLYAIKAKSATPLIHIKADTKIHDNFHITCSDRLEIGSSCLINRNVLITDTIHNYEDVTTPIISQGVRNKATVIGDGSWIGNNSVIICSSIGRNCVVSANTVIANKEIPDFCVVAGNPGKIIKRYDPQTKGWIKV